MKSSRSRNSDIEVNGVISNRELTESTLDLTMLESSSA